MNCYRLRLFALNCAAGIDENQPQIRTIAKLQSRGMCRMNGLITPFYVHGPIPVQAFQWPLGI